MAFAKAKCAGCGRTATIPVPLCGECQAREISGKPGGIVGWVPYVMTKVKGAGPFFTREARDAWYHTYQKTHPELVGKRLDCLEEVIPEAALTRLDG